MKNDIREAVVPPPASRVGCPFCGSADLAVYTEGGQCHGCGAQFLPRAVVPPPADVEAYARRLEAEAFCYDHHAKEVAFTDAGIDILRKLLAARGVPADPFTRRPDPVTPEELDE